jgi:hypothetical protein
MRFTASLAAILVTGLFFSSIPFEAAANSLQPVNPPTPIPAFKITGLGGSSGSDADLRNKVTVIRFWASW